jgi:hypothetical protein
MVNADDAAHSAVVLILDHCFISFRQDSGGCHRFLRFKEETERGHQVTVGFEISVRSPVAQLN